MKAEVARLAANLTCDILHAFLPRPLSRWGAAIRFEVDGISHDGEALAFALDSLWGLGLRTICFYLVQPFAALTLGRSLSREAFFDEIVSSPRALGLACATGAVAFGLFRLACAGAPFTHLGVNAGALVAGVAVVALASRVDGWRPGFMAIMTAAVLLAVAMLGDHAAGPARWLSFGGLPVQPSLILVPLMVVRYVRFPDGLSTMGVLLSAAALALQPDRAMAGVLAAGLVAGSAVRPGRLAVMASAAGVAAFALAIPRSDEGVTDPADLVLLSAFDVHPLAGAAVLSGVALLLAPALVGGVTDPGRRRVYVVFCAVWVSALAAAALDGAPTPVLGFSGAAVLGYVLSLAALPARAGPDVASTPGRLEHEAETADDALYAVCGPAR